jgi:hypothetical protein
MESATASRASIETCNQCHGEGKLRNQPPVKVPFKVPGPVKCVGLFIGSGVVGIVAPVALVRLLCLLNGLEFGDTARSFSAGLGGLVSIALMIVSGIIISESHGDL